jgi:hypothetical protein
VVAAVHVFTGTAQAQFDYYDTEETAEPFSIHAGAGFLSGDTDSSAVPIVGLQYEAPFSVDRSSNDNYITIGADYYSINTRTAGTVSIVPLLLGYEKYGIIGGYRVFVQVAAGTRWSSATIPELEIDKDFQFGWAVGLGVNITRSFLA